MTYESVKNWVMPMEYDPVELSKYSVDRTIASLLINRGIKPEEEQKFLYPTLSQIPDHNELYGAIEASSIIKKHIEKGSKIIIHGDFDADGICATTLLWEFLYRELSKHIDKKIDVLPYIPDRIEEGYGLSESSMDSLIKLGADLVITVDCGVRDDALVKRYISEKNIDMIITDHHVPPDDLFSRELPFVVVHPMHPNKPYPQESISGSMVSLLLTLALREEFEMDAQFSQDTYGLDLAAFSTVTDMMPLTGPNRALLSTGMIQLRKGERLGMNALAKQAGIELKDLDTYHIGFVLGPRINATGRIGNPIDGVRLLSTRTEKQATEIALQLEDLNSRRQLLTEEVMVKVEEQVDSEKPIVVAVGEDLPEGIIGLVAGKVMEKYSKPVLVISKGKDGARGSARSLGGFHITNVLDELSSYLNKYGGHSEAAGFSINNEMIPGFKDAIESIAQERIDPDAMIRELKIDIVLEGKELDMRFIELLQLTSPWGIGNPRPVQALLRCVVLEKLVMGKEQNHLKLKLKPDHPDTIDAVMFNCTEDIEKLQVDDLIDVAGNLTLNRWNGNVSVQFSVKEWRFTK